MVDQPHLAPTSGVLSPRWGLVVLLPVFQGLAPLATNPGSSGADTSNAHEDPARDDPAHEDNAHEDRAHDDRAHEGRNAGTPTTTSTSATNRGSR